ncbi:MULTISPECIES: cation diffusion facilitator family transporter [unclassified Kosmotoga]|uniref:cation diffusion facilitator family transporter n=1 Tax=unclassified Kosmotoga TaxID=2631489 RepID=UPI0007D7FCE4|nr:MULTISPECIES: cation diffusion facilitator family transporter [unclassified Kosmotoga]MDI3524206.1 cobalt-zinc-cadmium efflux system protein [Kosmotoga sp.]MDK2953798.1 cobalt-zinc-cadmium efflux system protein [Kosmotoga sp.]OAA23663.1 cation transporter [Kosmotoga sp. DU53]
MAYSHRKKHGHSHSFEDTSERRLLFSIVLNLGITLVEFIGGIVSNSLALISDSLHNLTDSSSMIVSYSAKRIARKKRTPFHTYGFKRAEILAAALNSIVLLAIALFLFVEALKKVFTPSEINGTVMLTVAVIGLLGNLFTAILLFNDAKKSLNVKSTFIHIVSDTLSSVFVIIAAVLIRNYGWIILDPLFTGVVGVFILFQSISILKESVHILMQGTPKDIELEKISKEIEKFDFVKNVHHLHVWTTDGHDKYLECHVELFDNNLEKADAYLDEINDLLERQFHIEHSTIQFEKDRCKKNGKQ